MRKTKFKIAAIVLAGVVMSISVFSVGYASQGTRMIQAWFGVNNVNYNSQDLTSDLDPMVIDGTTYVPLRKFANYLNKDIQWNPTTKTILVSDRVDATVSDLKNQIIVKDAQIASLQSDINKLKDKESNIDTLSDMEDKLNDDYGDYNSVSFDFTLSGDTDDITLKIEADDSDWNDEFSTSSKKLSFLQKVCDDILDEFDDADIEGYVRDDSSSTKLYSFYTTSSGTVKSGTSSSSDTDISDLEDTINDKLDDGYFGDFNDVSMSVDLDEDDGITYLVKINLNTYDSEYDTYLDNGDIEDMMYDIYHYIENHTDYSDGEIYGYVYDTHAGDKVAKYYETSSGSKKWDPDY